MYIRRFITYHYAVNPALRYGPAYEHRKYGTITKLLSPTSTCDCPFFPPFRPSFPERLASTSRHGDFEPLASRWAKGSHDPCVCIRVLMEETEAEATTGTGRVGRQQLLNSWSS
ncbi:hypothetical protein J6590_037257 [Homalodisca vitripennis]|nr:hypothetical protein J6590_037257 [Homalodisca vitripennis]